MLVRRYPDDAFAAEGKAERVVGQHDRHQVPHAPLALASLVDNQSPRLVEKTLTKLECRSAGGATTFVAPWAPLPQGSQFHPGRGCGMLRVRHVSCRGC